MNLTEISLRMEFFIYFERYICKRNDEKMFVIFKENDTGFSQGTIHCSIHCSDRTFNNKILPTTLCVCASQNNGGGDLQCECEAMGMNHDIDTSYTITHNCLTHII